MLGIFIFWNHVKSVTVLHSFDRALNKNWAAISYPTLFLSKLLTTQLWPDTEMKSWRGVSLDSGSGGHWFENTALGWKMCSGDITHTPKDGGTQWEITALSLSVHLPAMERAHCVPLGLILSHQKPQKPSDPITGIRPGPRPWDGEPRNRPESTAHSLKIKCVHTHIGSMGVRRIWERMALEVKVVQPFFLLALTLLWA